MFTPRSLWSSRFNYVFFLTCAPSSLFGNVSCPFPSPLTSRSSSSDFLRHVSDPSGVMVSRGSPLSLPFFCDFSFFCLPSFLFPPGYYPSPAIGSKANPQMQLLFKSCTLSSLLCLLALCLFPLHPPPSCFHSSQFFGRSVSSLLQWCPPAPEMIF